MWNNAATRRNVLQLSRDGVTMIGPNAGEMAEAGEAGVGRMSEPPKCRRGRRYPASAASRVHWQANRVLITAGPDA